MEVIFIKRYKAKRDSSSNYKISAHFPLFFGKNCDKCNVEIKLESMWDVQIICGRWVNKHTTENCGHSFHHKYFCQSCFPNINDGEQQLKEYCDSHTV